MRTLAFGDIHGCDTALATLLASVEIRPDDTLVFLGDYIDRGPGSQRVVEMLMDLGQTHRAIFLKGNHEVMILEARTNFLEANLWMSNCGGKETLISYGCTRWIGWKSFVPDTHWKFFEDTIDYLETETHIFVHGCLDPKLEMSKQRPAVLHWQRFEELKPHKSGKQIICGHTPQPLAKISNVGYAVCIDTGAATGGWLSCLDVASGQFWQANEKGQTRGGEIPVARQPLG